MKNNKQALLKIARKWFSLKSFQKTNSGKDFFETAVWSVEGALQEAYASGYRDAVNSRLR
jgi:hypothetical protein